MENEAVNKIIVVIVVIASLGALSYGAYILFFEEENGGSADDGPQGGVLPDAYFTNQNGNRIEIHDYKGRYLVVDLTGENCIYCPSQYEELKKVRNNHPQSEVAIVSIEVWGNPLENMTHVAEEYGLTWDYGVDTWGDFLYRWGGSVPRIFILNPEGRVIFEPSAGLIQAEDIEKFLP